MSEHVFCMHQMQIVLSHSHINLHNFIEIHIHILTAEFRSDKKQMYARVSSP